MGAVLDGAGHAGAVERHPRRAHRQSQTPRRDWGHQYVPAPPLRLENAH